MTDDPKWLREQARLWRDMAELGTPEQSNQRRKLADDFEEMAARLERPSRDSCV